MGPTTSAVLAQITQIVGWLPKREAALVDVLRGLTTIEEHTACECLSSSDLLTFKAHVGRLTESPLRTLLKRRIGQLGEQYGLGHDLRSTVPTLASRGHLALGEDRRTA